MQNGWDMEASNGGVWQDTQHDTGPGGPMEEPRGEGELSPLQEKPSR